MRRGYTFFEKCGLRVTVKPPKQPKKNQAPGSFAGGLLDSEKTPEFVPACLVHRECDESTQTVRPKVEFSTKRRTFQTELRILYSSFGDASGYRHAPPE
jgi:hypothetical protein